MLSKGQSPPPFMKLLSLLQLTLSHGEEEKFIPERQFPDDPLKLLG